MPPAIGCVCSGAPGARSTAASSRSATTATSWRSSAQSAEGLRLRTKDGRVADVEWRRLADSETGRLLLGFGHALTIDAAQGITSDEHINALPRGTSGVTAFTTYVAESRSRGTTWTVISEGARLRGRAAPPGARRHHADHHATTSGRGRPRTCREKPYKALGIDLLAAARHDREQAVDAFIACHSALSDAQLEDPDAGPKALARLRAAAVNDNLARHLQALGRAMEENASVVADLQRAREAREHLLALRAEAAAAKQRIEEAADAPPAPRRGPRPR